MTPLRLLISAGELSGDLYGAALVAALHRCSERPLDIRALGGPRMAAAGAQLLDDSSARASVGFVDPLRHLLPGLRALLRLRRLLGHWRPDAAVLVDYPGVNIPLAGLLHRRPGLPVAYFVPPEEHLWSRRGRRFLDRAHLLARRTDLVLTLHRHDTAFYAAQGCRVQRVGHPLLDAPPPPPRERARQQLAPGHAGPLVALLPASRPVELRLVWPVIATAAERMAVARPGLAFLLPAASPRLLPVLRDSLPRWPRLASRLHLVDPATTPDTTALVAAAADLAITKAGSVTLELALAGLPLVMVYRIDRFTEWVGRRLLGLSEEDFPFMSLPNLLLERTVIPEFKQRHADPRQVAATALGLLEPGGARRAAQREAFGRVREELGGTGAALRAARAVLALAGRENGTTG